MSLKKDSADYQASRRSIQEFKIFLLQENYKLKLHYKEDLKKLRENISRLLKNLYYSC